MYLIARREGRIIGAIGFIHDTTNRVIRVFELISLDDQVIRVLLEELERRYLGEWETINVEIDVRADAPSMQRTLLEFGFAPVAYVPAFVFHRVERLDVVRMMRLLSSLDVGEVALEPPTLQLAERVLEGFSRHEVLPRIAEVMGQVRLFQGLADEQGGTATPGSAPESGSSSAEIHPRRCTWCWNGEVSIHLPGDAEPVGHVGQGECVGEVGLLTGADHSARAVAVGDVEVGVLRGEDLNRLICQRPDVGVVLYRNLAEEIGEKLRRADRMSSRT